MNQPSPRFPFLVPLRFVTHNVGHRARVSSSTLSLDTVLTLFPASLVFSVWYLLLWFLFSLGLSIAYVSSPSCLVEEHTHVRSTLQTISLLPLADIRSTANTFRRRCSSRRVHPSTAART